MTFIPTLTGRRKHRASGTAAIATLATLTACSAMGTTTQDATPSRSIPSDAQSDPSSPDFRMSLETGQVGVEYIAHACFRIHSPGGQRIVIDPYANRVWIGYDFPESLATDAVLISHPHYDHDAGERMGHDFPWGNSVQVWRNPGTHGVGEIRITGINGKHADPYGMEFGQTNTIWLLEIEGLRIVHVGDNGPLTPENISELGRVDVLMLPIDAEQHILSNSEIDAIRSALNPRILIPMHFRHPDLEPDPDRPRDLGNIEHWLVGKTNVTRKPSNLLILERGSLPTGELILLRHSPLVQRPR